jgi:tetratricopeptide (TPR) repeat protein
MTPKLNDEVEERLRPSRFLGYDRDHIGVFLLTKEMYGVAEAQFRRAAYLNPYEGGFSQHLAWALFKQGKYEEAKRWIDESLRLKKDDPDSRHIAKRIQEVMATGESEDNRDER